MSAARRRRPQADSEALVIGGRQLLGALGQHCPPGDRDVLEALEAALAPPDAQRTWLALAVLGRSLPESGDVVRTLRRARLSGVVPALAEALADSGRLGPGPPAEVVTGRVLVDVHHTSVTSFSTGIQRVVRETVNRWRRHEDMLLVGWTPGYSGLRRLDDDEIRWVLDGPPPAPGRPAAPAHGRAELGRGILVPWDCTVIVPELAAEAERASRYQALARHSNSRTGVIGYDCVPLMASETSAEGMAGAFARYLAGAAHFDRLAAISDAAAAEYEGWRAMLAGSGRRGPQVRAVSLGVERRVPSEASMKEARRLLTVDGLPMVLAVGSHEPRKNHLAVLQAAEMLWREGLEFTLTFVGGNSWKSDAFNAQVLLLQGMNRPVQTVVALSDDLLWAAYAVAYCTVFVSVHEGFGLPVAESLASGTPVVTSCFGSMAEIADGGGALCVEPGDDRAVAGALRRLLRSEAFRQRLAQEAARRTWRKWDDYASEVWDFLTQAT